MEAATRVGDSRIATLAMIAARKSEIDFAGTDK